MVWAKRGISKGEVFYSSWEKEYKWTLYLLSLTILFLHQVYYF